MKIIKSLMLGGLVVAVSACTSGVKENQATAVNLNNDDLYEVHHDGRIHIFDDQATYKEFLEVGETSFRQTFIGAGPHGETLVFGMTGEDKKKPYSEIAGYNLYEGNLAAAEAFYGELRMDGRIYIFDRLEDMEAVRITGEAPLRYTQIGAGMNGETLVFVLRDDNKKQKPDALIDAYKQRNG